MKDYKKVQARVRAVRGFHEWDGIHERIVQEVVLVASRMAARIFACYCWVAVALQPLVCPKAWQSIVHSKSVQFALPCPQTLASSCCDEVGRRGLAHKPLPLSSHLLLDPNILTSDAFSAKGEKDWCQTASNLRHMSGAWHGREFGQLVARGRSVGPRRCQTSVHEVSSLPTSSPDCSPV